MKGKPSAWHMSKIIRSLSDRMKDKNLLYFNLKCQPVHKQSFMEDFKATRIICEESSRISAKVIDEFMIYYAASIDKTELRMSRDFAVYKHVIKEFKEEWTNRLKAQYLAHKVFKIDGLINKILNHVELKRLSRVELDFLEQQAKLPWKFSFSVIIDNPEKDFYIMRDTFSGDQYTLFSPGITDLMKSQHTTLWFNLIGYNGACWQTFGPIGAYKSFELDDIFFFATELRSHIETDDELLEDIENNPVPYMMLLAGANYPQTFHENDQIVQVYAEYDVETVNTQEFQKDFKVEYCQEIYRIMLKAWGDHPHFAQAYYNESEKTVLLSASTDRGFQTLVSKINQYGFTFSDEPFIRVNMSMLVTSKQILKKKIELNEYDHLFQEETSPADQEQIDKLNAFMGLVLPDINAGRQPDIEIMAHAAGIDVQTARDLMKNITNKFGKS